MAEESEDDNNHKKFPTVVVDGAHVHFLEGFVSLLFYLDKVFPVYSVDGKHDATYQTERQTLFDVRMSIHALKYFMADLQKGQEFYANIGLLADSRDFWTGVGSYQAKTNMATENLTDEDLDRTFKNSMTELVRGLSPNGMKKIMNLITQFFHEHLEELRKIAEEDSQKRNSAVEEKNE